MKLLGAVIEITPKELIIGMPSGLRGHVAYADASDYLATLKTTDNGKGGGTKSPGSSGKKRGGKDSKDSLSLSELFKIGQLVKCMIINLPTDNNNNNDNKAAAAGGGDGKRRRRIQLSLLTSKINKEISAKSLKKDMALTACVQSVEDHGYLLSFGIPGTSGFLPKKKAASISNIQRRTSPIITAGTLLQIVIEKEGSKPGAFIVTADPDTVASNVAKEGDGLNISSLQPGDLVAARVRSILSDGLLVSFLTFFSGTIDPFHIASHSTTSSSGSITDWKQQFTVNQRIKARLLYIDPVSKRVGLTLLKPLLSWNIPNTNFPQLGQVFEKAIIKRIDPDLGLLCELSTYNNIHDKKKKSDDDIEEEIVAPEEGVGKVHYVPGYVHISNVSDTNVDKLEGRFRVGQQLRARVIGFRPVDCLAVLSLKPSVVDQSILSAADVLPGMHITAEVLSAEDVGILLAITSTLKAMVPPHHMSDAPSAKAHKKFKVGQKVKGRVLSVDPSTKRVRVTLKPALVESKLPPLATLADAVPGSRSHGVVSNVTDYGVFVAFYGKVNGLASAVECGVPDGQHLSDAYKPGQAIKCRILGVDQQHKGLKLSFVTKSKQVAEEEAKGAMGGLGCGAIVTGVVRAVHRRKGHNNSNTAGADFGDEVINDGDRNNNNNINDNDDGHGDNDEAHAPQYYELDVYLSSSTYSKEKEQKPIATGRLEVGHLSDHPLAAKSLSEVIQVGSRFDSLMVLQRLESAKQLRVTRKASLMNAAATSKSTSTSVGDQLPTELIQLKEGQVIYGYVASLTHDAAFVRFGGNLTGRAGLAQLSDTFISEPSLRFAINHSVAARVLRVDADKGRFSISLKHSAVGQRNSQLLAALFRDSDAVTDQSLTGETTGDGDDGNAEGGNNNADVDWPAAFPFGGSVQAEVHEVKDYGVICDLAAHADVVGLIAPHLATGSTTMKAGAAFQGVVVDVSRKDGIVDLIPNTSSYLPPQSQSATIPASAAKGGKKSKKSKDSTGLVVGQHITCKILLSKPDEGYCVVIIPSTAASFSNNNGGAFTIGYLPAEESNLANIHNAVLPNPGESIEAVVSILPSEHSGGRLVLDHVPLSSSAAGGGIGITSKAAATKASQRTTSADAAAPQLPAPDFGSIVDAHVLSVGSTHADITFNNGERKGRIHVTMARDWTDSTDNDAIGGGHVESPLGFLQQLAGQSVQAIVLGRAEGRHRGLWELSSRPLLLQAAATKSPDKLKQALSETAINGWGGIVPGAKLKGWVIESTPQHVWVAFSPAIRGRAATAASVTSLQAVSTIASLYPPGRPVTATVVNVDPGKHALDVSLLTTDTTSTTSAEAVTTATAKPVVGAVMLGSVVAVAGTGVKIRLANGEPGTVSVTEIHDDPVDNVIAGLRAGQCVQVCILGQTGSGKEKEKGGGGGKQGGGWKLSLRKSRGGNGPHILAAKPPSNTNKELIQNATRTTKDSSSEGLMKTGSIAWGYIRSVSKAGAFVTLISTTTTTHDKDDDIDEEEVHARIRLKNLSSTFIENPSKSFPQGSLVVGKIVANTTTTTDSGNERRVELSLRNTNNSKLQQAADLELIEEGQILTGRVKRIEAFGVFVELQGGSVTGLAHKSELADAFVRDPGQLFSVGQTVKARVVGVDRKSGRLSLGLKPSYLSVGDEDGKVGSDEEEVSSGSGSGSDEDEEMREEGCDFEDELVEEAGGDDDMEE
jgi:rRNA biogenesis protein RRP5